MNGLVIRDKQTAVVLGAACLVAGTWFMYQAYDARGARRPFALHFLPGL
jgi:hypothetical protein